MKESLQERDVEVLTELEVSRTLLRLGQSLAREHDDRALLQIVTDEASKITAAGFGALFLYEPSAGVDRFSLRAVSGAPEATFSSLTAAEAAMLFGPAFGHGGIVRHDDVRQVPPDGKWRPLPDGALPLASYLAAPLIARTGEILGALVLGHPERARFSERHEAIVEVIAAQAAVALDNARLHQRERAARADAEAANRAKDEFLAMLGHELRNPLAPIVTALELLRVRGAGFERERTVIERQVRHMLGLVEDILDVSRMTRGKVHLERSRVDVASVIAKALEMASTVIEEKGHSVRLDLPKEPRPLYADPGRLAQILSNLVTNSAKYTDPHGHIDISVEEEEQETIFRVRDDGMGIAEELKPTLFNLFVQGERNAERGRGGLGIGLSVVQDLVALHGGTVVAESDGPGKGSCFTVRIPSIPAPDPAAGVEGTPFPAEPASAGLPRRILVIDDNRDAADLLGESLRTLGHQVRVAYSAARALKVLGEIQPDVVVLDIGLPGEDGYALAPRLRAASATPLTIIAVTGYAQDRDRERAAAAGFDAHLVKPVTAARLAATFRSETR